MLARTFTRRFSAQRAARSALKNPKAVDGQEFETVRQGAVWAYRIKAATPAATTKPKALGKRAQIEADAHAGVLPAPPDFSAETHARFRKRLAEIVGFVGAGDIKALKADTTEPKSSSRIALCRYRDLAIIALEAQRARKAAA
jgi:hypothetical protein